MKILKALLWCLFATLSLWLLWGCSTEQPDASVQRQLGSEPASIGVKPLNKNPSGAERVFTNANVVMWVPSRAKPIWDGPTSVVHVDETTPPGAFVKDYKIELDIEIVDIPEQLQQMERWSTSNWFYQDHPEVSVIDVQYGKQLRRDIWNLEKTRRLLISARVTRSTTFEEDVKTARKMIESIKLIPK